MDSDEQFWIGLSGAAVLTVLAAVLSVALTTGWTSELVLRAFIYSVSGVIIVCALRLVLKRRSIASAGSRARKAIGALMLAALLVAFGYAIWMITRPAPPPEKTPAPDATRALAIQLSRSEWAQNGESCERDGIRFAVEGNELAAYPMGARVIRYRLVSARGHQLTTDLDGTPVTFEVRADGFTHIEGEHERWFLLCD